jgi:peptide/nickel transport system permease protein
MLKYVARRLAQLVPVLIGISVLLFLGLHLVPGDVAQLLLGDKGTPEDLTRLRHELGLDKPVWVQYTIFARKAVHGDFGISLRTRRPALDEVWDALPMTVELSAAALLVSVLLGIPLGMLAARYQYSALDNVSMIGSSIGVSMPVFWTGLLLMMVFGGHFHWFPIGGILSQSVTLERVTGIHVLDGILTRNWPATGSALRHLVLPAIALGSIPMAIITRMTRSTMLEVLHTDYVRTARAKGLNERVVVMRHALRNALIPVVTVVGLQLGLLLSGAVLTETIFALPGLGRLVVTSLLARDYSVVQAAVLVTATGFVLINLLVDLLYAYLDPRIKYD